MSKLTGAFVMREGIYSISVSSQFDGFTSWHNITVDRAPSTSYTPPGDYVKITESTYVSPSGAGIMETFMPKEAQASQEVILVAASKAGSDVKKYGKTMGLDDIDYIAKNAFNVGAVWERLMQIVDGKSTVCGDFNGWSKFGEIFRVEPHTLYLLLTGGSLSPAAIMQMMYSGLGLINKQSGLGDFCLTSVADVMAGTGTVEAIPSESVVAIKTAFDYTKIPKATALSIDPSGILTNENLMNATTDKAILDRQAASAAGMDGGDLAYVPTGNSISQAMGRNRIMFADVGFVPTTISPQGISIDGSEATAGGQQLEVKAPVEKLKKNKPSLETNAPEYYDDDDAGENVNVAGIAVEASKALYEHMQEVMGAKILITSAGRSAVFDRAGPGAFDGISIGGSGISVQKVVLGSGDARHETETYDIGAEGVVTSVVSTMSSGLITTEVTFVAPLTPYD